MRRHLAGGDPGHLRLRRPAPAGPVVDRDGDRSRRRTRRDSAPAARSWPRASSPSSPWPRAARSASSSCWPSSATCRSAFTPAGPLAAPQEAAQAQEGTFTWRWNEPGVTGRACGQWELPTRSHQGAVMTFESQHDMKTDGVAGPAVWQPAAGRRLGRDGRHRRLQLRLRAEVAARDGPPSTATGRRCTPPWPTPGWPRRPTASGTFPVYVPLQGDHHVRHQPRRIEVRRPGHPVGQLLQRRATHCTASSAGSYGYPAERRVRRDASGQRRRGLPLTPIGTLVTVS